MFFRRVVKTMLLLSATLGIIGCNRSENSATEVGSMVRGETSRSSKLIFVCDDGESYETSSRDYGGGAARFSLTLPREAVCHLWIEGDDSGMISVSFRDQSGHRSPLIYLKSPRIDLGEIHTSLRTGLAEGDINDDALLLAMESDSFGREVAKSLTFVQMR